MSGNNMESMLMGGDDSSSGDSDDEVNVPMGTTAASAVAAMPATVQPQAPAPAPVPAPAPAPSPAPASNSQSDQLARLKSLYSSQPKRSTPTIPVGGTGTPLTINTSPSVSSSRPSPASQQQQQQSPPLQSNISPMTLTQAPPAVRPLVPNRQHQQPTPQQPQQQQQQPTRAPQPASHSSRQPQQKQVAHHSHAPPPSSQQQQQHHAPQQQQQQTGGEPMDPFAPTPLHRIKERHQQRQQQVEAQQRNQMTTPQSGSTSSHANTTNPSHVSTSSRSMPPPSSSAANTTSSRSAGAPQDRAAMERDLRRAKEKFLMFTRVLIKYLEQKDPKMHYQAKLIIKDCAERNKRQEPGYESVTASMKERLKKLVGEAYWKRAEAYLKHFLEQKKQGSSGGTGATSSSRTAAPSSSSSHHGGGHSSSQRYEQEKARKLQAAAAAKQRSGDTSAAPTIANLREEIANKRQAISSGAPKTGATSATATTATSSTAATSSGKGSSTAASKKQAASKRKSGSSTPTGASRKTSTTATTAAAASSPATPAAPVEPAEAPPREYAELMEMVDHAVDYDWTTSGLLLGSKTDLQLDDEQRNLLYGESTPKPPTQTTTTSGPRSEWGKHNVVSARAAWARVRLRELKTADTTPVVADGLLSLPGAATAATTPIPINTWVNEEMAEQDNALAMLSEGAEIYLKGILKKAIHCARQRQNLDGIRLWHQQHSSATNTTKPALSLRLGCDVSRQVAQADGNAAMTCKRMEQALERQTGVASRDRVLDGETLEKATSMADLAMRPQLAKGVEGADYSAKRSFETFGGKDALSEPPLGRVTKRAKLEVVDFMMGSNMTEGIGRHRAGNAAASIYF